MPAPLPVDAVLPEVVAALQASGACVLVAPTGAGKTTRLPGVLEDAGLGPVLVLEPRRLAARAAARRVAAERGATLGREVGWHVRFDRRATRDTRITFATEGVVVRRLQDDLFLEGVGSVVLDEFHERSLDVDLALALVARLRREVRPELKLVVTSATLDAEAVSAYLGGAPIVRSLGRLHPVQLEHLPPESAERDGAHVLRGVRRALERTDGDVLVFLPGVGEIRRAGEALADLARARNIALVELYGDLSPEAQDGALLRGPRRKVVLSTNVAESSVTVAGVTGVVDTGLARTLRHDPAVGMDRLVLGRISRASAEQRAGRAGREAPGVCLRLWSAAEDRALKAFDEPEVRRADLAGPALQLLCAGERDLAAFPWMEAPRPEALARALELLELLEATAGGAPTELGRVLARLPAHPRLARLLVEGHRRGALGHAALAAAVLGERDPRRRADGREPARHGSSSDVEDRVLALLDFARAGPAAAPELSPGAARACLDAADQLVSQAQEALGDSRGSGDQGDALLRALLFAFPDRLARRRADDPRRGVLAGGRGVKLAPSSAVGEGELFLALDLDAGQGEALVRQASLVERAWLDPAREEVEDTAVFDPVKERVVSRRRVTYAGLVLEESEGGSADKDAVEEALVGAARADLARALDLARPEIAGLLARLACLAQWMPELGLPHVGEEQLAELLPELAAGRRSFAELRRAPLAEHLLARLTRPQALALDREAPERLPVPSGSRIRLAYEPGRAPVLAARIQELFGLSATPRIAAGRVPVVIHLLAPNGRPQQITDDLASFWSGAYFDVKKELRRKYPRHAWPDDPTTATPERRPRRRSEGG